MKTPFLVSASLIIILATPITNAAPLESIIDAMAIKSSANHTNNGWESTSKITGVKWKWPYFESGAHNSTMLGATKLGKDKNPNIGATDIKISGARTMISSIDVSISNMPQGIEVFGKGKAAKIKTSCDEDRASYTVEFYKFEKSGYKPLYISYISSAGASGASVTSFKITYSLDPDALSLHSGAPPCRLLK